MQIGNYDTDNWGVVSAIEIEAPEVVTKFIEIPGRNGSIDATDALLGYPTYKDRLITIELGILGKTDEEYAAVFSDIYAKIHGKRLAVIMPSDPDYHYIGRWEVSTPERQHKKIRIMTLVCTAEPYALNNDITSIEIEEGDITLSSVMPTEITINAETLVKGARGTEEFTYSAGTHIITYPKLIGTEEWTIDEGSGSIEYQEGKL